MPDTDLAELYGVEIRALTQAVKRNRERFPADFMFQLTWPETHALRSQTVILEGAPEQKTDTRTTASQRGRHRKYRPYVFTEQGVAMLSSVLKSKRAVRVNIEIMRAFVKLRRLLASNAELGRRLDQLEARVGRHDQEFAAVVQAIRQLMEPPPGPKRKPIGFASENE